MVTAMPTTTSRLRHHQIPANSPNLQSPNGVKLLIYAHRNCVEGDGITANSCGLRKQLMEIARAAEWPWAV